jgi:hypothetical protein
MAPAPDKNFDDAPASPVEYIIRLCDLSKKIPLFHVVMSCCVCVI